MIDDFAIGLTHLLLLLAAWRLLSRSDLDRDGPVPVAAPGADGPRSARIPARRERARRV